MNARAASLSATATDLLALTKPRLSSLVLATTAGGMGLARGAFSPVRAVLTLVGVAATVGAANALNCYLERDVDRLMARTRNRPLPAGRMDPQTALWFGLSLAAVALPAIAVSANLLTAGLAAIALVSYVCVYTPLKARSWTAMLVGAVPGALPPLMGWTAVTGRVDGPGLVLFGILFLWQLPHFIAIALYRREEYASAGLHSVPLAVGDQSARLHIVGYSLLLVPVTAMLYAVGVAGMVYLVGALALGAAFLGYGLLGFFAKLGKVWARKLFLGSLVYLVGLFLVLFLDGAGR